MEDAVNIKDQGLQKINLMLDNCPKFRKTIGDHLFKKESQWRQENRGWLRSKGLKESISFDLKVCKDKVIIKLLYMDDSIHP